MIINIIIQARTSSKRFNSKILRKLFKESVIIHLINNLKKINHVNKIIVATSSENSDNNLCKILKKNNINIYRGSLNNVYSRYQICSILNKCDFFIRISADSPFLNVKLIQKFIEILKKNPETDILTNTKNRSFPKGQSVEICKTKKFISLKNKIVTNSEKEHVTEFFYNNFIKFKSLSINLRNKNKKNNLNCCIDYPRDIFLKKKYLNNFDIENLHKYLFIQKL